MQQFDNFVTFLITPLTHIRDLLFQYNNYLFLIYRLEHFVKHLNLFKRYK